MVSQLCKKISGRSFPIANTFNKCADRSGDRIVLDREFDGAGAVRLVGRHE